MKSKAIQREFRAVHREIAALKQQVWALIIAIVLGFGGLFYTTQQQEIRVVHVPMDTAQAK